jgi:GNAT superfamily N-acetyltransferase
MRLQEIERISQGVFNPDSVLTLQLQDLADLATWRPRLRSLQPRFYYRARQYGVLNWLIDLYFEEVQGRVRHIGQLETSRASHIPVPAQQVDRIAVAPNYQNMGVARELYRLYFKNAKQALIAGDSQTLGGRRMWTKLWQDPAVDVVGLIGIPDDQFDRWEDSPQFQKWVDGIMNIGGEYLGGRHYHWFQVPLRLLRQEMAILRNFDLYHNSIDDLIITMMAQSRGSR